MQNKFEKLVREFLTDRKVVGLVKLVKPLDIVRLLVKDHGLCSSDAANVTLELVKTSDPIKFERFVREGLPLGSMSAGEFPVPNRLKQKKDKIDEISPMRGEIEFIKHQFPPEKHLKKANNFPYDDQTVRWSRVRGTTPKAGHKT